MTDPELFVMRVWRQLAGGFRASVRRVGDEQVHHFSQPEEITRFLSIPERSRPDDPDPFDSPPHPDRSST